MRLIRSRKLDPARRRVLRDMTLGGGALLLASCTGKAKAQIESEVEIDEAQVDVNLLISEVTMERVAVMIYEAVIPALSEDVRFAAELFRDHHLEHVEHSEGHLHRLEQPIPDAPDPSVLERIPPLEGDLEILSTALVLEKQAVNTYLSQIGQFRGEALRIAAGEILGSELSHVIALKAALSGVGPLADLGAAVNLPFTTAINDAYY